MQVTLSVGTARLMTSLLETLADLPSTPALVARGAMHHLATIERELPSPHGRQAWDEDRPAVASIDVDVDTTLAVAELLEMFDEMPSTPPAVAADARDQAVYLRKALAELPGMEEDTD